MVTRKHLQARKLMDRVRGMPSTGEREVGWAVWKTLDRRTVTCRMDRAPTFLMRDIPPGTREFRIESPGGFADPVSEDEWKRVRALFWK